MPRNPNKTPCSVPGCRAWAIRGSKPPTCSPHRHTIAHSEPTPESQPKPVERPSDGQAPPSQPGTCPEADSYRVDPSQPKAFPEADDSQADASQPRVGAPPGNQNRLIHGFYATTLQPQDWDDLAACAADPALDAEIVVIRVALHRILGMLFTGHTLGPNPVPLNATEYARFAGLAFQGAGAVSRLIRARQALTGGRQGDLDRAIELALKELEEEWDVELL